MHEASGNFAGQRSRSQAGKRVDRRVAWCGLHRHPSLRGYAAFLEWAAGAPDAAEAGPEQLDLNDSLVAAAASEDVKLCHELLRTNSPNGHWQASHPCETPLHAAARRGALTVVKLLLDHSAKITAGTRNKVLPLHVAAQNGSSAVVEQLVVANAPLDAKDWNRWTALFFAVVGGSLAVAELLICSRCEVHGRDRWGRTALSWACSKGSAPVVKCLLEAKASMGQRLQARQAEKWQTDWKTEAHHAIAHPQCLQLLLEAGLGGGTDLQGRSVLHAAVEAGSEECVRLLLDAKALPDDGAVSLAGDDKRFSMLAAAKGRATAKAPQSQSLLFGIPAWQPAAVKKAVQGCFGRARVHVSSSGQGGVCLGTAVVEKEVKEETLTLHSENGTAQVGVTIASSQALADRCFPEAPVKIRSELSLTEPLPPRVVDLVVRLAGLGAGERPGPWSSWQEWCAWEPKECTAVLADPGALGLQLVYEGLPVRILRSSASWRCSAELLWTWKPGKMAGPAGVMVGEASAADMVGGRVALLWASQWPWPKASVELPCPDGALLVFAEPCEDLAKSLALAWHAAQPWRNSQSARRLWKGGYMGEK
eukprot:TRINITY_DN19772_c1_g1_i2.p1 TRINITY_DN19772_c1_g1~~TRINITY_DN19772_c1_g1_i2.p1  ORF type:complete len:592 (-),score=114.51 TRINITY_DN19772_c1_g1_i2:12-1787(-)